MEREYEFKKLELINDSKKKDLNVKKRDNEIEERDDKLKNLNAKFELKLEIQKEKNR